MKSRNSHLTSIALLLFLICASCRQSSQISDQSNAAEAKTTAVQQTDSPMDLAKAKAEVQQVLDDQITCWNEGRLACYMEGYLKSDSLVFVGKSGLTYGWQQTLDNYERNYPDKAAMGKLSFEIKEMNPLAYDTMLVIGKWHLKREAALGDLQGHFSIILKHFPEGWKIIADHSS